VKDDQKTKKEVLLPLEQQPKDEDKNEKKKKKVKQLNTWDLPAERKAGWAFRYIAEHQQLALFELDKTYVRAQEIVNAMDEESDDCKKAVDETAQYNLKKYQEELKKRKKKQQQPKKVKQGEHRDKRQRVSKTDEVATVSASSNSNSSSSSSSSNKSDAAQAAAAAAADSPADNSSKRKAPTKANKKKKKSLPEGEPLSLQNFKLLLGPQKEASHELSKRIPDGFYLVSMPVYVWLLRPYKSTGLTMHDFLYNNPHVAY